MTLYGLGWGTGMNRDERRGQALEHKPPILLSQQSERWLPLIRRKVIIQGHTKISLKS